MSVHARVITVLAVCALWMAPPHAALAQDITTLPIPLFEVSAGYTFMRDFSSDLPGDVNFPAGWYFSGAVNPNQWLGLVGEASGSYRNNLGFDVLGVTITNDASVYTLMGGPRFFHKAGRVVPFAQVLAGVAHMRIKTHIPVELADVGTISDSATEFAFQPGAGVTVYLTERVGFRVAGDYRCIIDFAGGEENQYANQLRVVSGFTLHWGR